MKKKTEVTPDLLDPKNYNTIIIDVNGKVADTGAVATLIRLLTDKENRIEVLRTLKEEDCGELLLSCIAVTEDQNEKQVLTAACWETDIDFSSKIDFFADLAMKEDYLVCLEAITVIENITAKIDPEIVERAVRSVNDNLYKVNNKEKSVLLEGLANTLENFRQPVEN
jgi:hypothetical protein